MKILNLLRSNSLEITIFLAIFIAFLIKSLIYIDPDFGWYIKTGEIISTKGIPLTDPFSYTMPSYPYADHEWLSNLLIYQLFHFLGKFGVAAIYCLIAVLSLFFIIPRGLIRYSYIPILASAVLIMPFVGIRQQLFGWLFLAVLLKVILDPKLWSRFKYLIPLVFLFWVNLHGSFVLGIFTLGLVLVIRPFQNLKTELLNILVFLFSFLSTLINPFGINIWLEALKISVNPSLRFTIMEWYPTILQPDLIIFICIGFSLAFFFRFKNQFSLAEKVIYIIFFIMALSGQKNVPDWAILNIYILTKSIKYFAEECSKNDLILRRFNLFNIITFLSILGLFFVQFILTLLRFSSFTESNYYPEQAAYFIQSQHFKGQVFAPYDWGGYLIWKLPQYKDFINGRMPSWEFKAPLGQTNNAFSDYLEIINGKTDFSHISSKYDIKIVLWKSSQPQIDLNSKLRALLEFATIHLYQPPKPFDFNKSLEGKGWKKIYQDNIAVVYQSPS